MPKLKLSKNALHVQRTQLQLYRRLLPSLDMKRRQLTVELKRAQSEYEESQQAVNKLDTTIGRELPMLAGGDIDLTGLVRLKKCVLEEENVVGVRLPVLRAIEVDVADYSMMARPTWVDQLVSRLRRAAEQRMRVQVASQRVEVLSKSLRQITQRVNLFERILIPEANKNIRRIRIFLGDLERDSVVRSKLAKSRSAASVVEDVA